MPAKAKKKPQRKKPSPKPKKKPQSEHIPVDATLDADFSGESHARK